ncbi:hypothetical protein BV898_14095 [Hypsibius exemplaris]|uniref:Transposase Tc5 C-terminal domain-containing protein n=1 Tax=Hypsibius exemplaris TaxID=2072580 RepID=A0A1W0W8S0_HYPEX|nr:hypothetical protein BV898_14095 [Hypsibius exemplaris]
MVKINPSNVVRLLLEAYVRWEKSDVYDHERELADNIRGVIDSYPTSTDMQEFLEAEDQLLSSQSLSQPSSDSSYHSTPEDPKTMNIVDFEYKKKAVLYWREEDGQPRQKKLKWESVRARYKQLPDNTTLYRWAALVDSGQKITMEKLKVIFEATQKRFIAARNERFKKKMNIVSRKVTKFVTRSYDDERVDLKVKPDEFLALEAKPYLENRGMAAFGNSDQSGFLRELHSGRSLTFRGERHVPGRIQSQNAMTHSYTIQSTITCDGRMFPQMLLCLQEVGGKFGPQVEKIMFDAPNIHAMASSSGKLTKAHVLSWFEKDYFPFAEKDSTILLDSRSGQKDQEAIDKLIPAGKTLRLLTIPAGATSMIQPCDVYLFRIWKSGVRKFEDRGMLDDLPVIFHQRDNIIELQSIMHNQFCSPRFKPQIQYAFYKAGYHDERPAKFQTMTEYCFDSVSLVEECYYCQRFYFMRCGWCTRALCFDCCWNGYENAGYHFCEDFVE